MIGDSGSRNGVYVNGERVLHQLLEPGAVLRAQAKLLRVIQEEEVMPLGASKRFKLDLRIVAATHRNLREQVQSGSFRPDLLARIDGLSISLPPLRERREDVLPPPAVAVRLPNARPAASRCSAAEPAPMKSPTH